MISGFLSGAVLSTMCEQDDIDFAERDYIVTDAYVVRGVCRCRSGSSPCACCVGTLCECAVSAIKEFRKKINCERWSWIRMTIVS
jgi:hypothetical protein